jgi:hypothetical protein
MLIKINFTFKYGRVLSGWLINPLISLGALQRKLKPTTEDYPDNFKLISWATLINVEFPSK